MRAFTSFLRTSFFLLIVCLGALAQAQTAPPSHAHRYPDAIIARLGVGEGQPELWLWQVSPGCYHGSCEIEAIGWFEIKHYFEFTVVLSMDDPTVGLRFQHEFRSIDEQDSLPDSDFWTTLVFDWDLGVFPQTEDFAAYFDDPVAVVQPSAGPPALAGGSGTAGVTQPGKPLAAPPPAPAPPSPSSPAATESAPPSYDAEGYDANGYDQHGVDRQGFNRDGVYIGLFDADGYDSSGYDRDGYDRLGYDRDGRDRDGYDYEGFNAAGVSRFGGYLYGYDQVYTAPNTLGARVYDERGFDQGGLNRNGTNYDDAGYDLWGYDKDGYNSQGVSALGAVRAVPASSSDEQAYDARGFASNGLHQNGTYYDDLGYDYFGYDSLGFDSAGYDRGGFDATGWNRLGIDTEGYDRDGRNARGFNRYGIHRNATLYDEQGFDMQGYNRQGVHYVASDYASPAKPTPPPPVATTGGSGWTDRQKTLADLLDGENFPFGPADLSDREVGEILQKYGSVDNITAEQWAELNQACLAAGLTKLWADLDDRIALVNLGFSDEDTDVLRAKQSQIEEYFLGADPSVTPTRLATAGKGEPAAKRAASALGANPAQATPPHDTMETASIEFAKSFLTGLVLAAVVVAALPAILAAGTVVLAAAGMSAATISAVGVAAETGLVAYAAYDAGKTVVEVKDDLAAGRLDAAASKLGSMTGTVVGGVGASKIIGGAASGAASKVAGEATEAKALVAAKEVEVGTTVAKAAAGGGKMLLAAEDCNAAGLKRLFDSLPKKADNGKIGYLKTEAEISEVWSQLEKTGAAVMEYGPGKLRMKLPDGTHVVKYGSTTDGTLTVAFNVTVKGSGTKTEQFKIHLKTK